LLLESAQSLPRLPMSIWSVVGVVLEFCLTHKARFNNHPQRLEELCRSLRRLMVMVTPCHLIDNRIYKNTAEVAAAMSRLSEHKEIAKADRKYAMYIATTLQDEWKRVLRTSGPTRSGPRGGKRSRPVAGSTQATDHPGISLVDTSVFGLQDDVLSLAEHVSDCVAIEVQLDAAEFQNRSCLDVIQDQLVSKVHSINITRRLQQSNNKNLLSTSLFQSDEIEALLTALFTKEHKDNHDCNGKLLISLMLWTGLPAEVLFTWQYNSTGPGLIVRDGRWFTQIFLAPLLTNAKPQKVVLTCPEQIAHFAKLLSAERTDQQLFTTKGLKSLDGAARQWLARISRRSGCELSFERVQNYIAERLQFGTSWDPCCLRLAFGTERNHYRVTRFYTQLSIEYVCKALSGLWRKCAAELNHPDVMPEGFCKIQPMTPLLRLGSNRSAEPKQFQRLTESLRSSLEKYSRQQVELSAKALVAYHNRFMEYCCLMLLSGTGCRTVRNPVPSLSLMFNNDLLLVCDKDDVDVATRVVILCDTLRQQMTFYLEHLRMLALRLSAVSTAPAFNNQRWLFSSENSDLNQIKNILKMKNELGQFFFLRQKQDELICVAVTPTELAKTLNKFDLATNAGRHYLRSELVDYGVSQELINQLIGHWSVGECPFSTWSQLSLYESRKILKPILNRIVGEQGWIPLRSKLV
jgi:hypothetical protein